MFGGFFMVVFDCFLVFFWCFLVLFGVFGGFSMGFLQVF